MSEVTRVPLQPIAKGSLTKLWIGVAAAVIIALLAAWRLAPDVFTSESGVRVETLEAGEGEPAGPDDVLFVNYVGTTAEGGVEFDRSTPVDLPVEGIFPEGTPLPLSRMIPGFAEGGQQMREGGRYRLFIPGEQAYGANPPEGSPIGPNEDLVFEVEVYDILTNQEFEQGLAQLQQVMQMMQGGQGMPGAPGATPPQEGAPPPPPPQ